MVERVRVWFRKIRTLTTGNSIFWLKAFHTETLQSFGFIVLLTAGACGTESLVMSTRISYLNPFNISYHELFHYMILLVKCQRDWKRIWCHFPLNIIRICYVSNFASPLRRSEQKPGAKGFAWMRYCMSGVWLSDNCIIYVN